MFGQTHLHQAGGVDLHPEHGQLDTADLLVGERLQTGHEGSVDAQCVGGLVHRGLGVPPVPDGRKGFLAGGIFAGQPGVEEHSEHLGPTSEVGKHLGDSPLAGIGRSRYLCGRQRLHQRRKA